jgi:hypothetical protein
MLFREIIAVYSENHMKHTNTLFGQNVELLNVEMGNIYIYIYTYYQCVLKG